MVMKNQHKSPAPSQNEQNTYNAETVSTTNPVRKFRNRIPQNEEAYSAEIDKLQALQKATRDEDREAEANFLSFVAECYFAQIHWARLLHYIVYNVPDTKGFPLWEAIYKGRALYRMLNAK